MHTLLCAFGNTRDETKIFVSYHIGPVSKSLGLIAFAAMYMNCECSWAILFIMGHVRDMWRARYSSTKKVVSSNQCTSAITLTSYGLGSLHTFWAEAHSPANTTPLTAGLCTSASEL